MFPMYWQSPELTQVKFYLKQGTVSNAKIRHILVAADTQYSIFFLKKCFRLIVPIHKTRFKIFTKSPILLGPLTSTFCSYLHRTINVSIATYSTIQAQKHLFLFYRSLRSTLPAQHPKKITQMKNLSRHSKAKGSEKAVPVVHLPVHSSTHVRVPRMCCVSLQRIHDAANILQQNKPTTRRGSLFRHLTTGRALYAWAHKRMKGFSILPTSLVLAPS